MRGQEARYTGTKIDVVLDQQGRRQDWLAGRVGVAPATVNRWVKGHRTLDHKSAVRIAEALGVPFFLLFDVPVGTDFVPDGNIREEVAS